MDAITSFGVIENAGPNHLRGFLKSHCKSAVGIDIAVAFVTQSGVLALLPSLKKASISGPVRIVTGLYQCITEPEALRALLAEQNDPNGRLSVRLSTNTHFHWKAYFILEDRKAKVVIGSSNMTTGGLSQSGEINAAITIRRDSLTFKSLHKLFEEEWRGAVPLNKEQIARYSKVRPRQLRVYPAISLKEILGNVQRHETVRGILDETGVQMQFWRGFTSGYVGEQTENVIADSTNWDDKGYYWYSSNDPRHRKEDKIVMFDFGDKWVRLVQIMDTTTTRTPDGRYFTAYKIVAKTHRRRITKELLTQLVKNGRLRNHSDAKRPKKLTVKTFDDLCADLGLR